MHVKPAYRTPDSTDFSMHPVVTDLTPRASQNPTLKIGWSETEIHRPHLMPRSRMLGSRNFRVQTRK